MLSISAGLPVPRKRPFASPQIEANMFITLINDFILWDKSSLHGCQFSVATTYPEEARLQKALRNNTRSNANQP